MKNLINKLKQLSLKKVVIITVICAVIIIGGYFLVVKVFKGAPKQIYEVAVMVRSQHNKDKDEDRRTSLKAGDILVTQKEGHKWSKTEKVSYLILKMNLTEEQATKLTRPEEEEIKLKDLSEEEQKRIKEEGREDEPRTKTIRAREYRIDMSEFEGFKAVDLLKGQPYSDEVYGWGIVERK